MRDDEIREQNRRSWNAATRAHNSHKVDEAGFLRAGGSTLFPEERGLLGDLRGLRLAHLQCNAGQDSLSLAALGAQVTGVDLSDEAIGSARRLAEAAGIAARFVQADVYDWLATAARGPERWDVVFSSYGALPWLRDVTLWGRGVAGVLDVGGRCVVVEFHPAATMLDEDWQLRFPYSSGGRALCTPEGVGDYVASSAEGLAPSGFRPGAGAFANPHACWEYFWSPFDVAGALLAAGLRIERLVEYPYSNGCRMWHDMRDLGGRRYAPPERVPALPLMYAIVARKA